MRLKRSCFPRPGKPARRRRAFSSVRDRRGSSIRGTKWLDLCVGCPGMWTVICRISGEGTPATGIARKNPICRDAREVQWVFSIPQSTSSSKWTDGCHREVLLHAIQVRLAPSSYFNARSNRAMPYLDFTSSGHLSHDEHGLRFDAIDATSPPQPPWPWRITMTKHLALDHAAWPCLHLGYLTRRILFPPLE